MILEREEAASPFEFVLLTLLGILWAIPYALTKIALQTVPPVTMVAARVSLAAIALWIIVLVSKRRLPPRRHFIPRLFVQGWLACILPYTLLALGQRSVDSALAAILNSTTPLFVFLFGLIWARHEKPTFRRLFGVSIGFAGVVIILGGSALFEVGRPGFGQIAIILATVASAAGVIHAHRFAAIPPELTAAGTLTSAALVLVPLSFVVEAPLHTVPSIAAIIAVLVNGVVVTAVGFAVYFHLIRTIGSMGTASVSYLKPAIGALIGYTLMGESLTWPAVTGLIAVLLGVTTINQKLSSGIPSSLVPRLAVRAVRTN